MFEASFRVSQKGEKKIIKHIYKCLAIKYLLSYIYALEYLQWWPQGLGLVNRITKTSQ